MVALAFHGARARLVEAAKKVEDKVEALNDAVEKLKDWRLVVITNLPRNVDYPAPMLVSPVHPHVNGQLLDQLSLALEHYHKCQAEALDLWKSLPDDVRAQYPEPT